MDFLNSLFRSLTFTKVQNPRNLDGYTTYAAKLQSFTNGDRYVMLIVRTLPTEPPYAKIDQLSWISLQTRTIVNGPNLPLQALDHKALDHRYATEKYKLVVRERTDTKTEYRCDILPLEIVLLHDPKKKSAYQYPDTLEIRQALNTFQCVISI